jgi:hypothetical protein
MHLESSCGDFGIFRLLPGIDPRAIYRDDITFIRAAITLIRRRIHSVSQCSRVFIVLSVGLRAVDVRADYRGERIASDLAQPTFVSQAPGDPANIIYYATRITAADGAGGGFGAVTNMGGIFRYDMHTRMSTQVMNLSYRQLTGGEGLVGFAFSPDFNTPGAPGYQKLYVSSSQFNNGASPIERIEEYTVDPLNGTVPVDESGQAVPSQLLLQYNNINTQQNHTVDWIAFDPIAASLPVGSPERNYFGSHQLQLSLPITRFVQYNHVSPPQ